LSISSSTLNSAQVILNGIGGAAGAMQMQPAVLDFSTVGVGTASQTQTITLTNIGPVDLAAMTVSPSSGFQLTSTSCTAVLPVGTSCAATIAFAPVAAGPQTGTLTVSSSALASPTVASLSGVGFDFALSLAGAASQTVSSGQTATFTLALIPKNGSSGTFTFQCGSLPATALCSFNPVSESVAAGTTGNVSVQVTTGHSARSIHQPDKKIWGSLIVLCGVVVWPFMLRRKRITLRLAIMLLALTGCVMGCAGSGGGSGGTAAGGQGTSSAAAGTYTIPITATANGVAHTVTVTVTID
jgi:hypothetical protein